MAAQHALQNLDPARQAAPLLAALRQRFAQPVAALAFVALAAALGGEFLPNGGQTLRETLVGGDEFLQFEIDRRERFGGVRRTQAQTLRFAAEIVDLRLAPDGFR